MVAVPDYTSCYSTSYARARDRFKDVALEKGGVLSSYLHPDQKGPEGEDLTVDVAVFGDPKAPRRLFVLSGTHGLEGFATSASQIAFLLAGGVDNLPKDVAVVMGHAINPYGFAHLTRGTENNVDLNRNFVDHSKPYPENPGYAELHPFLIPTDWTGEVLERNRQGVAAFAEKVGPDVLFDTMARGQYTHQKGTNYGGTSREWSNYALEKIVADHLSGSERVAFIDWHTGIGEYGEPFFLCFNEEGSDLQAEAVRWWSKERVMGVLPHGRKRPDYKGLVFNGVTQFLGDVPMVGAVIEFGTRGMHTRRAIQLDIWLKYFAEADSERVRLLKIDLVDAYVPVSAHWRESTVAHAIEITQQALDGLITWTDQQTQQSKIA